MTVDMTRGTARSADGVDIAFWTGGVGPQLLLIHGITSTHLTYDELVPHLASRRTVTVYDRRGRGESGETSESYDIASEYEDALAVIDALGVDQVDVFGHSFGAYIAIGATESDEERHIRKMILYSPGFGDRYPEETLAAIDMLVAHGERDRALGILLTDIIGMPQEEVDFMRKSPAWAARIESVHTVARECRADRDFKLEAERLGLVDVPTLVVSGETNPENKRAVATRLAAMLGNATETAISGEGHVAHHTAPGRLAEMIFEFTDRD